MENKFGKKIQPNGLENLRKRYYIKTKNIIDQLIEDYRPSSLEKSTSGFKDVVISF